jgi:D-3-phosphoglycerate dehydrogenase
MPDWKIIITDKLPAIAQERIQGAAHVDDKNGISKADLLEIVSDYDGMIVRSRTKVTADVFEVATRLKVVGRAGVGVDNIDLAAARAHNVTVVNSPTATTTAVAEHTLAMMLALARAVPRADATMKAGEWIKKELRGVELAGKTLGVIGVGRIGEQVAARAAAFGMASIGYDPLLTDDQIRQRGLEPVALDELYNRSDIITLHVPLNDKTRNMIGEGALSRMKHGVRLICTARGGVIDESALLAALESGQVAGAALDVFAEEPPGLTGVVSHPHVVVSPHIAAQTIEAQARTATDIAEEVLAALEGKTLRWRVA